MPVCMVKQVATIFRKDPVEVRLKRLVARIQRIQSRNPSKVGGRHAYCRSLMESYRQRRSDGCYAHHNCGSRSVIKNHGKLWRSMAARRKVFYDSTAKDLQEEITHKHKTLLHSLRAKKQKFLQEQRVAQEKGRSVDLLGKARLNDADLLKYDKLYDSGRFTRNLVDVSCEVAQTPLKPPSSLEVATLDLFNIEALAKISVGPPWAAWMAHNRDFFIHVVIRFSRPDACFFYKLAYAVQRPVLLARHRLEEIALAEPYLGPAFLRDPVEAWDHTFCIDHSKTYYSDEGWFDADDATIHFLLEAHMRKSGYFETSSDYITLADSRAHLNCPGDLLEHNEGDNKCKVEAEPWMEDPAMWDIVRDGVVMFPTVAKPPMKPAGQDDPASDSEDSDVDSTLDALEALDAVAAKREELLGEHDGAEDDAFVWDIRGGAWTMGHCGLSHDSFRASARTLGAKEWCTYYQLRHSMTCSIRRYTEVWCIELCNLWVSRMQFFYGLWKANGSDWGFRYTDPKIDTFVEDPQVQAKVDEGCNVDTLARLRTVRGTRPR